MLSRIARQPITMPQGVEVKASGQEVTVKGKHGSLIFNLPSCIGIAQNDNELSITVTENDGRSNVVALAGTARAILNNMVIGVSQGFEKKLQLVGVGYRAQLKGKVLGLTLGLSHPVEHKIPEGITIECPSQTEVIIKGIDKQKVGQVAAEIRSYRPPEPYKGKGIRYADERIVRKEAKKK